MGGNNVRRGSVNDSDEVSSINKTTKIFFAGFNSVESKFWWSVGGGFLKELESCSKGLERKGIMLDVAHF